MHPLFELEIKFPGSRPEIVIRREFRFNVSKVAVLRNSEFKFDFSIIEALDFIFSGIDSIFKRLRVVIILLGLLVLTERFHIL